MRQAAQVVDVALQLRHQQQRLAGVDLQAAHHPPLRAGETVQVVVGLQQRAGQPGLHQGGRALAPARARRARFGRIGVHAVHHRGHERHARRLQALVEVQRLVQGHARGTGHQHEA